MHRPQWQRTVAAPAAVLVVLLFAAPGHAQLNIVINPNATLAGNAPALAAFNRAAAQWESRLTDNITVTIDAGLASLSPGVLGSTSSVTLSGSYTTIRNQMVLTAAGQPDNSIVASLPTAAQFSAIVPAGTTISGTMFATKANLKAMGFTGLDGPGFGGPTDATITFSTNFTFDFDNSNGVTAGQTDFETVASHEIGHALGFVSGVDQFDTGETTINMRPLDLFRFQSSGVNDPSTPAEFTTFPRELRPNTDASFDTASTLGEFRMSTGRNLGDGFQASHWKADDITGVNIGIMDPSLAPGDVFLPTVADLRAFDLIGWEPVPEPGSVLAAAFLGLAAAGAVRRRRAAA